MEKKFFLQFIIHSGGGGEGKRGKKEERGGRSRNNPLISYGKGCRSFVGECWVCFVFLVVGVVNDKYIYKRGSGVRCVGCFVGRGGRGKGRGREGTCFVLQKNQKEQRKKMLLGLGEAANC